jgi:butyrate kinase
MGAARPRILVINPGGTSTKVALFAGEREQFIENVRHPAADLAGFERVIDQLEWRADLIRRMLDDRGVRVDGLDAVVGRGAALAPVPSGTFAIEQPMLDAIARGDVLVEHPSLLGPPIAHGLAAAAGCPAYVVDPVSVDELDDAARITGLPAVPRRALSHALSVKAAARRAATRLGRPLEELDLIVLHLGSGFTVAAQHHGRQIDANDASASGPLAPTRTGDLPVLDFARFCLTGGRSLAEIEKLLVGGGGWMAHLGTDDIREIYRRIDAGDQTARLVIDGTLLQLAKEVGGLFAVLAGQVNALVLAGGVARSERFVAELEGRLAWVGAPLFVFSGENEMLALARGALRVLEGECAVLSMTPYLGGGERGAECSSSD